MLKARESVTETQPELALSRCSSLPPKASEFAMYVAQLASSTGNGGSLRHGSEMDLLSVLQKPVEPDFSIDASD